MTTAKKWSAKDPSDIADYWFDWTDFLPADENITDADVTVPAGLESVTQDFTEKVVRVRLSGGTVDTDYPIDCLITTDAGEVFESTKTLSVKERIK